jgi:hypothetical protein
MPERAPTPTIASRFTLPLGRGDLIETTSTAEVSCSRAVAAYLAALQEKQCRWLAQLIPPRLDADSDVS